jgi:hypothetical protein
MSVRSIGKYRNLLVACGVATVLVVACSKSSGDDGGGGGVSTPVDCSGVNISFATDVRPLIQTKCAINSGCHGAGSLNAGGELNTYAQISGKSASIRNQVIRRLMPQGSSLSSAQINTIVCWVDAGAKND